MDSSSPATLCLTRRKDGLRLSDPEWALIEPLLPRHADGDAQKLLAALPSLNSA